MKAFSAIFCLLTISLSWAAERVEYVIPDSPPAACLLQIPKVKSCTTFPLIPGLYLTAAHCVLDYNYKTKKITPYSADQVKMYCPRAVDPSQPKEALYHFSFHQMEIVRVIANPKYNFDLLDQNDFALVFTTYSINTGKPFPKLAFSEGLQSDLLRLNKCRAGGFSRGFYAENLSREDSVSTIEDGILKVSTASAHGDSGGPIYCQNEEGEDIVVGINSSIIGDIPILPAAKWVQGQLKEISLKAEASE